MNGRSLGAANQIVPILACWSDSSRVIPSIQLIVWSIYMYLQFSLFFPCNNLPPIFPMWGSSFILLSCVISLKYHRVYTPDPTCLTYCTTWSSACHYEVPICDSWYSSNVDLFPCLKYSTIAEILQISCSLQPGTRRLRNIKSVKFALITNALAMLEVWYVPQQVSIIAPRNWETMSITS